MSSQSFTVGFYTIKTRGKIDSNYKTLAQLLQERGFNPIKFAEFPISREKLASIDILVIPCPDNNKFNKNEIQALKTWVSEDGGGLLMLSHAGGDKGRRTNLTELSEQFGMIFENNQVLDKFNNLGVENLPIIEDFSIPHPINENLHRIVFRAGCSLSTAGINVSPVISSGPKADPFESPLILACEDGEGRAVAVGSYEMFRDKIAGGITQDDHQQLAQNIFNWLKTTRREQIKQGIAPAFSPSAYAQSDISLGTNSSTSSPASSAFPSANQYAPSPGGSQGQPYIGAKTFESNVKILANEDLLNAFETTLNEFFNFKQRVLEDLNRFETNLALLMKAVLASEKDIIAFNQQQTSEQPNNGMATQVEPVGNLSEPAAASNNYGNTTPKEITPEDIFADLKSEIEKTTLTSLGEDISSEPAINNEPSPKEIKSSASVSSSSTIKKPKQKEKSAHKSKEELEQELGTLENKLNSIKNLRQFVEKKHTEGNLSDKRYEKQIKKLDEDTAEANTRIKEIQELLK